MHNIEDIKQIIKEHKDKIEKKYNVKEIGVFGSVVHGEQTENSDIDILVEFDEKAITGFFEFIELEDYLKKIINCEVDLVTKTALKPRIGKRILQELIII